MGTARRLSRPARIARCRSTLAPQSDSTNSGPIATIPGRVNLCERQSQNVWAGTTRAHAAPAGNIRSVTARRSGKKELRTGIMGRTSITESRADETNENRANITHDRARPGQRSMIPSIFERAEMRIDAEVDLLVPNFVISSRNTMALVKLAYQDGFTKLTVIRYITDP